MRVVILALLFLPVFLIGEAFGAFRCIEPDEVVKVAPQPVTQQNQSSFRGIGLASRPLDVQWRAQSLGFVTQTSHYVGDTELPRLISARRAKRLAAPISIGKQRWFACR